MAKQSEQARLIASLTSKGYSIKDIATLTGRTPRYITFARDSIEKVGRGGKISSGKGQNLIPFLKELDTRGKVSPASVPGKRTTKAGKTASVRKGATKVTTTSGKQQTQVRVKRGPETLKRTISDAGVTGSGVRWNIKFKKIKLKSGPTKKDAWVSGHLPAGWNAQTLQNRINNPQEGDKWKAGDVNGALMAIAMKQNSNTITSATGVSEFNLFTLN